MLTRLTRAYSTLKPEARLSALRASMTQLDAFVVPTEDAHQSEYTAECDNRRAWISGFTGSAGCAVITQNDAALFTDGRYFLQASQELDQAHWKLMKTGLPNVPTWQEYLYKNIPANSTIGIDPSVITFNDAEGLCNELNSIGSKLVFVESNPIDEIRQDRPPRPTQPIQLHPLKYAGESIQQKLKNLRESCKGTNIIVSSLDEIAWLLNLRGADIHCSPVFFSYCLVTKDNATLYIQSAAKITPEAQQELNQAGVMIKDYDTILNNLECINEPCIVNPETTNMSLVKAIGLDNAVARFGPTDISVRKAIKNEAELKGVRDCHKRDAVALCKHFSWLSSALVEKGQTIREYEAATHLESMRQKDDRYVGLSFDTIAATGANGAIIHYQPDAKHSSIIDPRQIYLCDSGAQYKDGTTDVTRTWLFDGVPSIFQKRAFTRVLQSHIAVDQAVFPQGNTTGYHLDAVARIPLWKDGLDFRHGVGHGIGAYLNVHEGPHGIGKRLDYNNLPLQANMLVTNEPGFYQDGEFGIRLENVLAVRKEKTPYRFGDTDYLGFEHVTFVPFGNRLLEAQLLSNQDKEWINAYHQECRQVLEPLLKNDRQTLLWVEQETKPL